MKKLGVGSFEEYEKIEKIINRELKIVQMAQAELLELRVLELERREDEAVDLTEST